MASPGLEQREKLRQGGFSEDDIANWELWTRSRFRAGGFSSDDIDNYFGGPPVSPDIDGLRELIETNFERAGAIPQREAKNLWEFFLAGNQVSIGVDLPGDLGFGLLERQKPPDLVAPKEHSFAQGIARDLGTLAGDLPVMTAGFLLGGGPASPITGLAGAFSLPAGMRRVLIEAYTNGNIDSFERFWEVFSATMIDAGKGAIVGGATGAAGKIAAGGANALGVPSLPFTLATEVPVLAKVGAALDGRVPEPSEFAALGLMLGTLRGAGAAATALTSRAMSVYAKTGRHPKQIVEDAKVDPTITEDMLSRNHETPRAYRSIAEGETASNGAATRKPTVRLEEAQAATDRISARLDELKGRPVTKAEIKEAVAEREASITSAIEAAERQLSVLGESIEAARPKPVDLPRSLDGASLELRVRVEKDARALNASLNDVSRNLDQRLSLSPELLERATRLLDESAKVIRPHLITREGTEAKLRLSVKERDPDFKKIMDNLSVGEFDPKPGYGWSDFMRQWVDRLHPLREAVEVMRSGRPLKAAEDPYLLARLEVASASKGTHFVQFSTRDFDTFLPNGKGLREILDPGYDPAGGFTGRLRNISRGSKNALDLDELRVFLAAKRAVELEERGIPSGFDRIAARRKSIDLEEKYGSVQRDLVDFQGRVADYARKAGLLSEEGLVLMQEANQQYVPFARVLEPPAKGGVGKGFEARSPFKRIKGTDDLKTVDPIESIIKNTFFTISQAEKNAVARAFVELAETSEKGSLFARKVKQKVRPIKLTPKEVKQLKRRINNDPMAELSKDQVSRLDEVLENEFSMFRPDAFRPEKGKIFVWRDGKREQWQVDPKLWEVFQAGDIQSANALAKMFQIPARTLRAGAILSPEFLARNPIRDNLSAYLFSDNGFKPFLDFTRGIFSIMRKDEKFQDWLFSGGPQAALVSIDRNYLQSNLREIIQETRFTDQARNVVTRPIEWLRILSETAEEGTRVGEFRRGRKSRTKEDILRAGLASREVSLDFGRMGTAGRTMNQYVAFFNAWTQGADKIRREFQSHPTRLTARAFASITLPSLTLWAMNHDKEWYKQRAAWEKDLLLMIPIGGTPDAPDRIISLQRPFESGLLFGRFAELIAESVIGDDPASTRQLLETLSRGATPSFMPQSVTPIIEAATNFSFFRGSPIIPRGMEDELPQLQYKFYTTELTKAIAKAMSSLPVVGDTRLVSPLILDNFVRQWTGGLGAHIVNLMDASLRKSGVLPDPPRPETDVTERPFIKAFFLRHPRAGQGRVNEFFRRSKLAERALNSIKGLAGRGDIGEAERLLDLYDENELVNLVGYRSAISSLGRAANMAAVDPEITPEEKNQLIEQFLILRDDLAKRGMDLMDQLDADAERRQKEKKQEARRERKEADPVPSQPSASGFSAPQSSVSRPRPSNEPLQAP